MTRGKGRYSAAGGLLGAVTFLLLLLAAYAVFFARSPVHFVRGYEHFELSLRWVGGWALGAALLSWCGRRYCRCRARSGEPTEGDLAWFWGAKVLLVLGVLVLLGFLMMPRIVV